MTEIETLYSLAHRAGNMTEIIVEGLIPDEHAPEFVALVDDLAEAVKDVLDRAQDPAEQPILRGILADLGVARTSLERQSKSGLSATVRAGE